MRPHESRLTGPPTSTFRERRRIPAGTLRMGTQHLLGRRYFVTGAHLAEKSSPAIASQLGDATFRAASSGES